MMYETEKEPDRKILYKDTTIEIEGKKSKKCDGIIGWKLKVKKGGQDEKEMTVNYSMYHLSDIVNGIEDYYTLNAAIDNNFEFEEHKNKLIKLWLEIGRIAREIGIYASGRVAYIKPEEIYIKGTKVMPKPWANPIYKETVITYSNLGFDYYNKNTPEEGLYFRLSAYDDQKKNNYYIDLDPISDREEIEKLLEDSIAIYMPDLSTNYNMKSMVYTYAKEMRQ